MREGFFSGVISSRKKGLIAALARFLLGILSLLYGIMVFAGKVAYAVRLKRSKKLSVPVISVGNVTAGGTGKTPLTALIANMLRDAGHKPAILSRGYKATGGSNDEAGVLTRTAPGIPHLQGKDRVVNGRKAIDGHNATCLVLDDGFQHRRLARDLDVVAIDALNPFGYGRLLPRGLLREPLKALRRANVFVVTHADQVSEKTLALITETLSKIAPGVPVTTAVHAVTELVKPGGGKREKPKALAGKNVLAFCGIGNPRSFKATVLALGAKPKLFIGMKDHQHYPIYLLKKIEKAAEELDVEAVVTTEKDAVKFSDWEWPKPCWVVRVDMKLLSGADEFKRRVLETAAPSEDRETGD